MARNNKQPKSITCQYYSWRLMRRDGVYYADGRSAKHNLGKHSLGTRSQTVALEQLKLLDQQKAIEFGVIKPSASLAMSLITIADGWQQYLVSLDSNSVLGGASHPTIKRYGAVRDKHQLYCQKNGIENWQSFDDQALRRYGKWLTTRHADRTMYLELTLLKSINGWMIDRKLLLPENKLTLSLRKPQGTDTYCYSSLEVTAMLDHCSKDKRLGWLAAVIVALAHTGMRISELVSLRWTDIKFDAGIICVADERSSRMKRTAGTARTTKGRRSRTIPMHEELHQLLAILPRKPDGFVFHAAYGGRLRTRNVLEQFIKHVIEPLKKSFVTPEGEIGFEHGRLHSFRHFFCSQCFLGGASEGEIKEWLGHADSKMVEHYRHLRSEDARRKMNQIRFLDRGDGASACG